MRIGHQVLETSGEAGVSNDRDAFAAGQRTIDLAHVRRVAIDTGRPPGNYRLAL
jgi:hypothetical protein